MKININFKCHRPAGTINLNRLQSNSVSNWKNESTVIKMKININFKCHRPAGTINLNRLQSNYKPTSIFLYAIHPLIFFSSHSPLVIILWHLLWFFDIWSNLYVICIYLKDIIWNSNPIQSCLTIPFPHVKQSHPPPLQAELSSCHGLISTEQPPSCFLFLTPIHLRHINTCIVPLVGRKGYFSIL